MQHIESVRRTKERTRGCNPSFCRPSSYTAMAGTSRGGCQVPTHFLVIIITIPIVTIFISEYIGCDVGFTKFLCLFASYVMIQHPRVYEQGKRERQEDWSVLFGAIGPSSICPLCPVQGCFVPQPRGDPPRNPHISILLFHPRNWEILCQQKHHQITFCGLIIYI